MELFPQGHRASMDGSKVLFTHSFEYDSEVLCIHTLRMRLLRYMSKANAL